MEKIGIRKTAERIIVSLLCIVILLMYSGAGVFAEDNVKTVEVSSYIELLNAVGDAKDTKTPTIIKLSSDINVNFLNFEVKNDADITIMPSGRSVTISRAARFTDPLFDVKEGCKLTLKSDGNNTLTVDGKNIEANNPLVNTAGTFTTDGVTLKNGNNGKSKDAYGGAVYAYGGLVTLENSTLSGNTAGDAGGAVYASNCTLKLSSATFTGNSSIGGGAIYNNKVTSTIDNCTFKDNQATRISGGAIFGFNGSHMTVNSGTFTGNKAGAMGGAIYNDEGCKQIYTDKTAFTGNTAESAGGGIWNCPFGTSSYYTFAGVSFYGNSVKVKGDDISIETSKSGYDMNKEYISDLNYAGESLGWYKDVEGSRYSDGTRDKAELSYHQNTNKEVDMHSTLSEEKYNESAGKAAITFTDNHSSSEGGAIANNGSISIGNKSGLLISKEVKGEGAPADDEFQFTVTFSDGGTYDGVASGSTVTTKAGGKIVIAGVPQGIGYTVTEQSKSGYTAEKATITGTIGEYGSTAAFVNTYAKPSPPEPVYGTVKVTKLWNDNDNAAGVRPASISIALLDGAGNDTGKTLTLNNENKWTGEFTGLAADTSGYTVRETDVSNYRAEYMSTDGNFTITNTYVPEKPIPDAGTITVHKIWKDNNNKAQVRTAKVDIMLFHNGKYTGKYITLNKKNGWTGKFTGLNSDTSGYTVEEAKVDYYRAEYKRSGDKYTVTNSYNVRAHDNQSDNYGSNEPHAPDTGDDSPIGVYITLLLLSGALLAAVIYWNKRN